MQRHPVVRPPRQQVEYVPLTWGRSVIHKGRDQSRHLSVGLQVVKLFSIGIRNVETVFDFVHTDE